MNENPWELARVLEHTWPNEQRDVVAQLLDCSTAALSQEVLAASRAGCGVCDLDGLDGWLADYQFSMPSCQAQAASAAGHPCLPLTLLGAAGTYAAAGLTEPMFTLCERIFELLQISEARLALPGTAESGNGKIRGLVCGYLAQAKWEGPEALRDRVMNSQSVARHYRQAADRVLAQAARCTSMDGRMTQAAVATLGVDVAAMLYRWDRDAEPGALAAFLGWYNDRLGIQLAEPVGHYLTHQPLANSSQYWTYELVKLHLSGCLAESMLDHCRARRQAAAFRELGKARFPEGTYCIWARQDEMMRAAIRRETLA